MFTHLFQNVPKVFDRSLGHVSATPGLLPGGENRGDDLLKLGVMNFSQFSSSIWDCTSMVGHGAR